MKATFLLDLDIETDTDLIGVAEELKDAINQHFHYACLAARPWARASTLQQPSQQTLGGVSIPPQQP